MSSKLDKPKLSFSDGFAFWDGWGADFERCDYEAIYVTISAVLQNMRESICDSHPVDCLRSHVYQHAVLSPENFVRFNDPILQSCIWRAANSTELDYRRSDELGHAMATIIMRTIADVESIKSETAVDFLMGIAIGRIRLSKRILEELVSYIRRVVGGKDYVLVLLDYIESKHIQKPQ